MHAKLLQFLEGFLVPENCDSNQISQKSHLKFRTIYKIFITHNHRPKLGAPALCNGYSTTHLRSSISLLEQTSGGAEPNQLHLKNGGSQQEELVKNLGRWTKNENHLKLSEATIICVVSLAERILSIWHVTICYT